MINGRGIAARANLVATMSENGSLSANTKKQVNVENLITPKKVIGSNEVSFSGIGQANTWFRYNNNISVTSVFYHSDRNIRICYQVLDSYNGTYQFEQIMKFNVIRKEGHDAIVDKWRAENPGKTYVWSTSSSLSIGQPSMLLIGLASFQRLSGVVLYKGL